MNKPASSKPASSNSGSQTILTVQLTHETDFLLARQRAKQLAKILGFDVQDQTRIATAVSEIARNAFEYGRGGRAEFSLEQAQEQALSDLRDPHDAHGSPDLRGPRLQIVVTDDGKGIADIDEIWSGTYESQTGMGVGMTGARRLMDGLDVQTSATGTRVRMIKYLPRNAGGPPTLASIVEKLAQEQPRGAGTRGILQEQNVELVSLLTELRAREAELQTLNAELAETNRGVLVLYAELEDKAMAVQAASEMKTRFLSGVTHELRTPLNSIVSLSRLMLSYTDGPLNVEQERQAQFILRSAQNLNEMVNDLLDLARLEAGKAPTNLTEFTVADIFAGLRGMFRPLVTNPNVKLLIETPDETLRLRSDEGKLAQVLRNFISNAIKFTEEGTITLTAECVGGPMIRFSVADSGVGIAPENHELVMQEWGQVQSPQTSGKGKGSGLGLPLAKSLAELLGGSVDFTSEPGVGSTFRVTLPALLDETSLSEPTAGADFILMIDDDEVARYLLRRHLGSLTQTRLEEAKSGREGLATIARELPRLVFLDVSMPEMNGWEVARELRSRQETARLPVVMYTSKTLSAEERRTLVELELATISKRDDAHDDHDEQQVELERALLGVGLSNMHQGENRRGSSPR